MTDQQKQMRGWSDEKLDRELAFADGSVGDDTNAAQWLDDIKSEVEQRKRGMKD